uniref:Uncharacterized protein n=2 Tax=Oryza TaxID=4527 RepID=A0A0E0HYY4_ORYNI|nr:conserved+hypothetical+protein [Oryza rufipogon]
MESNTTNQQKQHHHDEHHVPMMCRGHPPVPLPLSQCRGRCRTVLWQAHTSATSLRHFPVQWALEVVIVAVVHTERAVVDWWQRSTHWRGPWPPPLPSRPRAPPSTEQAACASGSATAAEQAARAPGTATEQAAAAVEQTTATEQATAVRAAAAEQATTAEQAAATAAAE